MGEQRNKSHSATILVLKKEEEKEETDLLDMTILATYNDWLSESQLRKVTEIPCPISPSCFFCPEWCTL